MAPPKKYLHVAFLVFVDVAVLFGVLVLMSFRNFAQLCLNDTIIT